MLAVTVKLGKCNSIVKFELSSQTTVRQCGYEDIPQLPLPKVNIAANPTSGRVFDVRHKSSLRGAVRCIVEGGFACIWHLSGTHGLRKGGAGALRETTNASTSKACGWLPCS